MPAQSILDAASTPEIRALMAKLWTARENRVRRTPEQYWDRRYRWLAPKAKAHIDSGACAGDLCNWCNGTGDDKYEPGAATQLCSCCNGRGIV